MTRKTLWPILSSSLNLNVILKVTQDNKTAGACCNTVTICTEMNVRGRAGKVGSSVNVGPHCHSIAGMEFN